MKTYIVKTGIFEGKKFTGELKNNRIYNRSTIGQSFEEKNCVEYDYLLEILLKESELRNKNTKKMLELILDLCFFSYVLYYFKLENDFYSNTKKELVQKMFNYLNNEGFEKYSQLIKN